jgi:REP element-mobilizing transposase RayT
MGGNMSYVKVWIHAVWGTKNRYPILTNDFRQELFGHIKANAKEKQICIDTINGYLDHIHCLFLLNADMSTSKAMQLIKGESAHWANKSSTFKPRLEWANEYYAVSVGASMVNRVREYIKTQEEHHRKESFQEECDEFLRKYNPKSHG